MKRTIPVRIKVQELKTSNKKSQGKQINRSTDHKCKSHGCQYYNTYDTKDCIHYGQMIIL